MHKLPDSFQCFGVKTRWEARPIIRALLTETAVPTLKAVRVFLNGADVSWDLDAWSLWTHLVKLVTSNTDVAVTVVVPNPVLDKLAEATGHRLGSRTKAVGIQLVSIPIEDARVRSNGWRRMEIGTESYGIRWALFDGKLLAPNET